MTSANSVIKIKYFFPMIIFNPKISVICLQNSTVKQDGSNALISKSKSVSWGIIIHTLIKKQFSPFPLTIN